MGVFLIIFLAIIFEYNFFKIFHERKEETKTIFRTGIIFTGYFLIRYYLFFNTQKPMFRLVLMLLVFFVFLELLFKGALKKKLFTLVFFLMTFSLIEVSTIYMTQQLTAFSDIFNHTRIAFIQLSFFILLMRILQKKGVSLAGIAFSLKKRKYIILIVMTFLVYLTFYSYLINGNQEVKIENYQNHPQLSLYFLLYFILMVIFLYIFYQLEKSIEVKQRSRSIKQLNLSYERQINLLRNNHMQIKTIEDKYSKQLRIIKRQLINGEVYKSKGFINKISKSIGSSQQYIETGSELCDSILNYKINFAKSKGIQVKHSIQLQEELRIEALDLTIILGNIFDNALEALEKIDSDQIITFEMFLKKGVVTIHLKNPYAGKLRIEKGQIRTTKKEKELHGYGLKSIKKAIKKYQGDMVLDYANQSFDLKIVLFNV